MHADLRVLQHCHSLLHRYGYPLLVMSEQGVPQLVEGPAVQFLKLFMACAGAGQRAGRELERLSGPPVGQPRSPGDRAQVAGGDRAARLAGGQEHWALAPPGQRPGQQHGGA